MNRAGLVGRIVARRERVVMASLELRGPGVSALTLGELRAFVAAAFEYSDDAVLYALNGDHLSGVRLSTSDRLPECKDCNGAGTIYTDIVAPEGCESCRGTGDPVTSEPVEREPRTWAKAEDVPPSTLVRPTGSVDTGFRWRRSDASHFWQWHLGNSDGVTDQASLTETWPDGFVEVLS